MYKLSQDIINSFKEDCNNNLDTPNLTRRDFVTNIQFLAFLSYIEKLHKEIELLQTNRKLLNLENAQLKSDKLALKVQRNRAYNELGWEIEKVKEYKDV